MSYSTFTGLNTALRGLMAQQTALDVTSHNIANVNTEGFTRQKADMVTAVSLAQPGINSMVTSQLGTGVLVDGFTRVRDMYLDRTLRQEQGRLGDADTTLGALSQVEAAFAEPGDSGLSASIREFFSAMEKLAAQPQDMSVRQTFAQRADAMANDFNRLAADLESVRAQSDERLDDQVTQINSVLTRIAGLNTDIRDAVLAGQDPNDLRDSRDMLMDDLASRINFTYTRSANDEITISFPTTVPGPTLLVDPTTAPGFTPVTRAFLDNAYSAVPPQLTSGSVLADERVYNTTIPAFQARLDNLAASLVGGINTQQALGFDLGGNQPAGDIFDAGMLTAATMRLDAGTNILGNPQRIAAASTWGGANGEPGNGQNAAAMLGMRGTPQGAPLGATWESYYAATVADLGSRVEEATKSSNGKQVLVDTLKSRRAETSGVSLDEEMTNMLRFQNAYNASARALTALDEALDTLINRMGRVGL